MSNADLEQLLIVLRRHGVRFYRLEHTQIELYESAPAEPSAEPPSKVTPQVEQMPSDDELLFASSPYPEPDPADTGPAADTE